jgi:hypothetical protein
MHWLNACRPLWKRWGRVIVFQLFITTPTALLQKRMQNEQHFYAFLQQGRVSLCSLPVRLGDYTWNATS